MAKAKSRVTISVPAFPGRAVVKSQAKYDVASAKLSLTHESTMSMLFNSWIDQCHAAGVDKSDEGTNAIRAAIMTNDDILRAIHEGLWTRDTIGNYAQGAMRAFYHGEKWTPRAFLAEDKGGLPALPWSKKAGKADDKRTARTPVAKQADDAAPADKISGPNDALEARKFIRGQLNTLVAYGNKHAKTLDLTTRDVLAQLAKLMGTIDKIDAAPVQGS